jgi:hypothetical protein
MKILSFLLMMLLTFSCCNNEEEEDYRHGFLGDYSCQETGYLMCNGQIICSIDTIVTVNIGIYKDSMITILNDTLRVNKEGKFGGGYYTVPDFIFFGGYFKNDSIIFQTAAGGIACNNLLKYKGKKQ